EREVEAGRAGIALSARATTQLVVDAARLVPLGAEDVHAAGLDHLLALAGALLLEAGEDLLEALLVLLRRLLQLLANLLDRGDVLHALVLVAPLRRAQPLLERRLLGVVPALDVDVGVLRALVRLAPGGELAVAGDGPLDQQRQLELPQ